MSGLSEVGGGDAYIQIGQESFELSESKMESGRKIEVVQPEGDKKSYYVSQQKFNQMTSRINESSKGGVSLKAKKITIHTGQGGTVGRVVMQGGKGNPIKRIFGHGGRKSQNVNLRQESRSTYVNKSNKELLNSIKNSGISIPVKNSNSVSQSELESHQLSVVRLVLSQTDQDWEVVAHNHLEGMNLNAGQHSSRNGMAPKATQTVTSTCKDADGKDVFLSTRISPKEQWYQDIRNAMGK